MTFIIVTDTDTIAGKPVRTYQAAFEQATRRFGDDVGIWMAQNIRIEENR